MIYDIKNLERIYGFEGLKDLMKEVKVDIDYVKNEEQKKRLKRFLIELENYCLNNKSNTQLNLKEKKCQKF